LRKDDERYYTVPFWDKGRLLCGWYRVEKVVEVAGVHLALEGGVVEILDGLHAAGDGGVDVLGLVVDEEDVGSWGLERLGGVTVDGGLGFGEVDGVGPDVVVKGFDPEMTSTEANLHVLWHVGEDAGTDAGALEASRPFEHGRVELRPEIGVCFDELGELGGGKVDSSAGGDAVPEGRGVHVAAIVGVAVGPVTVAERFFAETGDGAHASPGGGVGWAGENHAVVEENCLYQSHGYLL
jgi:hypothetical protein